MRFRLTPQMASALRAGQSPIVPLIEVLLPDYALRQAVGSIEVPWGEKWFRGEDPRFGVLVAAGNIEDGVADEAPEWSLTLAPPSNTAVEQLTDAGLQGAIVNGWIGALDRATGQLLPEPLQVFAGELDVARLRIGKASRTVEWRCVSALERFHDVERGARLSDAWHRLIWPDEAGCAGMTGVERTSYWGVEKPPSGVTYGPGRAVSSLFAQVAP